MQTLTLSLKTHPVTGTSLERMIKGIRRWGRRKTGMRKTYAQDRRGGRFFGRRVNCEQVPLLPAGAVAQMLDDPRKIPYLLVWKSPSDGTVQEVVRAAAEVAPDPLPRQTGWVEIKRADGWCSFIRTVLSPLPRNRGKARLLVCPYCQAPRRGLYGWTPGGRFTSSVQRTHWQCRVCAGLRYASEGEALVLRSRWPFFRVLETAYGRSRSPRPEPWIPYVFSSPRDAAVAGFCMLK